MTQRIGRTKPVTTNRRARHDYEILESFEAGIVLIGAEIKAIREGQATFSDAYARPENGELWLHNAHISHYSAASPGTQHDPKRRRKLLMHKVQIRRLTKQVTERGLTIIPLKMYIKNHRAKLELGLAKGKKLHDKRRSIIDRAREREAQEALSRGRLPR